MQDELQHVLAEDCLAVCRNWQQHSKKANADADNSFKALYAVDKVLPRCFPRVLQTLFTAQQWPVGSSTSGAEERVPCLEEADTLFDLLKLYGVFACKKIPAQVRSFLEGPLLLDNQHVPLQILHTLTAELHLWLSGCWT
jgi:hypothetical protein